MAVKQFTIAFRCGGCVEEFTFELPLALMTRFKWWLYTNGIVE